jgi:hypothetical protein
MNIRDLCITLGWWGKRMKKAPVKVKNESNSSLFVNFLTQSGGFCNFFTRSTGCTKISITIINIKVFLFLLVFVNGASFSATYYVCDCSSGADVDCIAGDDAANGTLQTPWQSYEKARTTFSTMSAGDAIKFCDGGYWSVNGSAKWVNSNCRADNYCRVENYTADWVSGDENLPILERLDFNPMFSFANGGTAKHQEGYLFQNMQLKGSGVLQSGFFIFNDIDDVVINNVTVSNFGFGVSVQAANPCAIDDLMCDGINQRITLSNSTIINNIQQGWIGGSSGGRILNNYFENNGADRSAGLEHNIYVTSSGGGGELHDMKVIGNKLYHAALDANGVCLGTSLVVHGIINNLLIENNTVWEDVGFAGDKCWGIAVDSGGHGDAFTNIIIRGNTVRNVGGHGIGVSLCADCIIENNVIIQEQNYFKAIVAPDKNIVAGEEVLDRLIVRNNSIYFANGAIGTAIEVSKQGSNHQIVSNAIYYAGSSPNFNCLQTTNLNNLAFDAIDNNICYHPNSSAAEWVEAIGSLTAWQASSGFDGNSSEVNPGFTNPVNNDLSPVSINSNMVDSGHVILSSTNDILGISRDAIPDIGAYEWLANDMIFVNGFE